MTASAKTWTGHCTRCSRDGLEVGSRRSHGERVLCEHCAARPYSMPTAEGLDRPRRATSSVTSNGGRVAPDRYAGRRVDVTALLAEPDTPIPWRCDRLAADGYLTVLAGRGGEGKSWLALTLALGVSTGTPRAGIACTKGRAVLLDAENGRDLLRRRLRAAGVTGGVGVVLVDGLDIVKDAEWFEQIIREEDANLVVVDSLRMLTSGRDEDKSGDMEAPLSTLRRIARSSGAAVLLVHHRGKGPSETRGSSVIRDQCDLLFTLGRETGDPEQRTRRRLHTAKCRIDEEPEPRWLAIVADRPRGLVTVDQAAAYEADGGGRPRDAHRDNVLQLLDETPRSGRSVGVELDLSEPTTRRLLHDLSADGLVERRPGGWVRHRVTSLGPDAPDAPHGNRAGAGDRLFAVDGSRRPPDDLAPPCRCLAPLPAPDAEGELRCARCGLSVTRPWAR